MDQEFVLLLAHICARIRVCVCVQTFALFPYKIKSAANASKHNLNVIKSHCKSVQS